MREVTDLERHAKKAKEYRNATETPETTNLVLTPEGLRDKLLLEPDGKLLCELIANGEGPVMEVIGVCKIDHKSEGGPFVKIPGYNDFLAHLRICLKETNGIPISTVDLWSMDLLIVVSGKRRQS